MIELNDLSSKKQGKSPKRTHETTNKHQIKNNLKKNTSEPKTLAVVIEMHNN